MFSGIVYLLLATLLWSGNYIAGRVLAPDISALALNGIRWSLSAIELWLILKISGRTLPLFKKWRAFLLLGLLGMLIFSGLTYLGLHTVVAAQAGLISGCIPAMILFFSILLLKERPSIRAWIGMVISVLGIVVLFGLGHALTGERFNLGDVELLIAALAWGLYTVLGRKFGTDLSPLTLTTGAAIYGAVLSDMVGLATLHHAVFHLTGSAWFALLYVSTAASVVAYVVWTLGVERMGASKAAPYMNLLPIWTVLLGVLLLGEHIHFTQIIGGLLILLGAVLAGWPQRKNQQKR